MTWYRCDKNSLPSEISYRVLTTSTGGNNAAISLTQYTDGVQTDYKNIVYNSASTLVKFHDLGVLYSNGWKLRSCVDYIKYDSALYTNGDLINSWAYNVSVDMQMTTHVPLEKVPSIIAGYSMNMIATGTLSHTFTESGIFQYIIFQRIGEAPVPSDPPITLNGTTLTPTRYEHNTPGQLFLYGELTVTNGDVLTVTNNNTTVNQHSGLQLFIFKNVDLDLFKVVGLTWNDGSVFAEPNGKWIFQVYRCGYYGSNNNFSYRLQKQIGKNDSNDMNYENSIPTPSSDSRYYYGFSYSIVVRE